MKLAGLVAASINAWEPMDVMIDEVSIGAGVVDRLKEQGYRVRGINVGTTAQDNEHYANLRAEGYWNLRQIFTDGTIVLPSDNELIGQIAALRYSFNSQGKAVIESKDEMKRRGVPCQQKKSAALGLNNYPKTAKIGRPGPSTSLRAEALEAEGSGRAG